MHCKLDRIHSMDWRGLNWLAVVIICTLLGCKRNNGDIAPGYPEEIGKLMGRSCATSGCHNGQSAAAAGGLNLESWDALFEGSRGGSPVVPFSTELSYLMYSVNNDPTLGPVLLPTMPYNQPTLTVEEYDELWNWIFEGARNAEGELRFPNDPGRRKWYVGHNQCDVVAVFDVESRQIMRFIDVGIRPETVESIFDIKVTPDGQDWIVVFAGTGTHMERYSTLTDEKVADIQLGNYGWNKIVFTPDSKFAFVAGDFWKEMVVVDLEQNAVVGSPVSFAQENFGPVLHPTRQQVYLAQFSYQNLYVLDYDNNGALSNQREVDLIQNTPPAIPGPILPNEILFLPDGSKYFVSCANSREVRVLDGQTDSLLQVIVLPAEPNSLAYSTTTGKLFVCCMDDLVSWGGDPSRRGSISVVDPQSYQIEDVLYTGFQPYGMQVDEQEGLLVVANRNIDESGPAPHHASTCDGRNGYVSLINLNTLQLVPDFKPELLVNPITVAIK